MREFGKRSFQDLRPQAEPGSEVCELNSYKKSTTENTEKDKYLYLLVFSSVPSLCSVVKNEHEWILGILAQSRSVGTRNGPSLINPRTDFGYDYDYG